MRMLFVILIMLFTFSIWADDIYWCPETEIIDRTPKIAWDEFDTANLDRARLDCFERYKFQKPCLRIFWRLEEVDYAVCNVGEGREN